jgi:hypothetical protein
MSRFFCLGGNILTWFLDIFSQFIIDLCNLRLDNRLN